MQAPTEIAGLAVAADWAAGELDCPDLLVVGDLNAGGQFMRAADWTDCPLQGEQFTWLIEDHQVGLHSLIFN